jgi:hypothetical protein
MDGITQLVWAGFELDADLADCALETVMELP